MEQINARSIFSPATGYIRRGGFDWTCNPYIGCSFGCTYCYAMFLPQNRRPRELWGKWFQAKINAVELARKEAPRLAGQAVYLSSVTDPYLPAERSLRLTRGILEVLVAPQPRLLVQTRGPLVVRDIDCLRQFDAVRINVSIPTDSDEVRRAFEPKAPPLEDRWQALRTLRAAGLPVGICLTPLLPLADLPSFAQQLADFAPEVVVTENFHKSNGAFGGDTGPAARLLLRDRGWTAAEYQRSLAFLGERLDPLEGESGFYPPVARGSYSSSVRTA
jgi:DNA repair photolyase